MVCLSTRGTPRTQTYGHVPTWMMENKYGPYELVVSDG